MEWSSENLYFPCCVGIYVEFNLQVFPYQKGALDAVMGMALFNAELHLLTVIMDDSQNWLSPPTLVGKQNGVNKQGILRAISIISTVTVAMRQPPTPQQKHLGKPLDLYFVFYRAEASPETKGVLKNNLPRANFAKNWSEVNCRTYYERKEI